MSTATNPTYQRQIIWHRPTFDMDQPLWQEREELWPSKWNQPAADHVWYVGDFQKPINKKDVSDAINWTNYAVNDQRVVIIRGAELMNQTASNTLLKTLEHPPAGVFFWLCTTKLHLILPTIRSRCAVISTKQRPQKNINQELLAVAQQFIRQLPTIASWNYPSAWQRYSSEELTTIGQLLIRYWSNLWARTNSQDQSQIYLNNIKATEQLLTMIFQAPYQTKYWLELWRCQLKPHA